MTTEESEKWFHDKLDDIAQRRTEIRTAFTEAYLAETGLPPSQCEMVEQWRGTEVIVFFRKRTSTDLPNGDIKHNDNVKPGHTLRGFSEYER